MSNGRESTAPANELSWEEFVKANTLQKGGNVSVQMELVCGCMYLRVRACARVHRLKKNEVCVSECESSASVMRAVSDQRSVLQCVRT